MGGPIVTGDDRPLVERLLDFDDGLENCIFRLLSQALMVGTLVRVIRMFCTVKFGMTSTDDIRAQTANSTTAKNQSFKTLLSNQNLLQTIRIMRLANGPHQAQRIPSLRRIKRTTLNLSSDSVVALSEFIGRIRSGQFSADRRRL
jgi:hypothetical protein